MLGVSEGSRPFHLPGRRSGRSTSYTFAVYLDGPERDMGGARDLFIVELTEAYVAFTSEDNDVELPRAEACC